ncbi:MAG: HEAT repeat domain-containing protein [Bryobacteraceae bacterium]|nr:HEAT repeat domain-containing protein [Bryobacteraceae bacterium]
MAYALPALLLALAALCQAQKNVSGKVSKMSPQQVADLVKRNDWRVLDAPQILTPQAGEAILPLVSDPNPNVRELAVNALSLTGGTAAKQGFYRALKDRVETIRAAAMNHLAKSYQAEDLPNLAREFTTNDHEYVRERIALILGQSAGPGAAPYLQAQLGKEPDPDAKHAMSIALARLGDPGQQQAWMARLTNENAQSRTKALEDLLYIQDRRLLPYLMPLFDDARIAKNVGPSHAQWYIRVCDLAVQVLQAVLGQPLPFPVTLTARYNAQQLSAAKVIVSQIR